MVPVLCTNCQVGIPSQDSWQLHSVGSRIDELLNSNEAPLEGETDPIRSYLTGANNRLRYVENSITKLEESLASMEAERKRLKEHIRNGRNVLNPIRRTPVEVLESIFECCIAEEVAAIQIDERRLLENGGTLVGGNSVKSQKFVSSSLDLTGAHWVLGYVCQRWRSVILTNPRFWTDIRLELDKSSHRLSWRTLLLKEYIGRSQSLPLYISLSAVEDISRMRYNGSHESRCEHVNTAHSLVTVLFLSVSRWCSLYLSGMSPYVIQRCFSSIGHWMASLRLLSIITNVSTFASPDGHVFQQAHSLRELVLRGTKSGVLLTTDNVPIRQITGLEIESTYMDLSQFLRCLGEMKHLVKLVMKSVSLDRSNGLNVAASLSLPRVNHFELHTEMATVDPLLTILLLPGLDTLSVSKASPGSIQSFITRSQCLLTRLTLMDTKISKRDLIILLTDNPSLVAIDLKEIQGLTNEGITQLTVRESWEPRLPKLEVICLCGSMSFDAAIFVNMIESRWRASGLSGGNISRPRLIELGRSSETESQPRNISAFDQFNEDRFKGLRWKTSNYTIDGDS